PWRNRFVASCALSPRWRTPSFARGSSKRLLSGDRILQTSDVTRNRAKRLLPSKRLQSRAGKTPAPAGTWRGRAGRGGCGLALHGAGEAADDPLLEDGEEDQRGQHRQ